MLGGGGGGRVEKHYLKNSNIDKRDVVIFGPCIAQGVGIFDLITPTQPVPLEMQSILLTYSSAIAPA